MNIVERIARMIDAEGAYARGYGSTGSDAALLPLTTRQKYFQAKYECLAVEIVKLFKDTPNGELRNDLIEWEKAGWLRLGVPIDDPKFKDLADGIIEKKYAGGRQ